MSGVLNIDHFCFWFTRHEMWMKSEFTAKYLNYIISKAIMDPDVLILGRQLSLL